MLDYSNVGKVVQNNENALIYHGPPILYDYWHPIRDDINRIAKMLACTPFPFDDAVTTVERIIEYTTAFHGAHSNAYSALIQGVDFALYLRNFDYAGGRKIKLVGMDPTNPQSYSRRADVRIRGGDEYLIPALQDLLQVPLIFLAGSYSFKEQGSWSWLARSFGYRAHGHNWKSVFRELAAAARMIVLLGEKDVASCEYENSYILDNGFAEKTCAIVIRE